MPSWSSCFDVTDSQQLSTTTLNNGNVNNGNVNNGRP